MNDSYTFSEMPFAEKSSTADDTLWSFTGIKLIPTANELTLLFDPVTQRRLLVRYEVGITLTHCEAFRTLRGHAEYLVGVLPELGGQIEPIIPVLEQIRDAGMLRSAGELLKNLAPVEPAVELPPIQVFIITCDRPEAVERLLKSMAKAPSAELAERYTLIDDSRNNENAAKNAALVSQFGKSGRLNINYFGATERRRLIQSLTSALPEHESSINFLLDSTRWKQYPTYGLSRTIALLLGIGKRVVVFDDDVLCEAIRSPLPANRISLGGVNGRQAVFYADQEEMDLQASPLRDSLIALMSRQLGATVGQGLSSLSHGEVTQSMLRGANGAFVRSLSPSSRIVQTQCGSWGDTGIGGNHWIVDLDIDSIGRLLDLEGGFTHGLNSQTCWLGYASPTFTKHGSMSQVTGYDAASLLPPFMPAFRGEDALFSCMTTILHPDSLVLNGNWAAPHRPLEDRQESRLKQPVPSRGGMTLLTDWLSECSHLLTPSCPETQLRKLAAELQGLSQQSPKMLLAMSEESLARRHAFQLTTYQDQLSQAEQLKSSNWVAYLQRGSQELQKAINAPASMQDLFGVSVTDENSALTGIKDGLAQASEALEAWPEVWAAASE